MRYLASSLFAALLIAAPSFASAGEGKEMSDEAQRIEDATLVVHEFAGMSEGAPRGLVEKAAGVIVIPGLKKAGLILGGKHGSGVLCVRDAGGQWGEPVFVKMTGGSIGWQIGVSSTDLILLFMREKNIQRILDGEFTIGADAAVAAGPVGRSGSAGTSADLEAEIYSYSRSRGAFAGISIDGSKLYVDKSTNAAFYGEKADVHAIIKQKPKSSSPGERLLAALAALNAAK